MKTKTKKTITISNTHSHAKKAEPETNYLFSKTCLYRSIESDVLLLLSYVCMSVSVVVADIRIRSHLLSKRQQQLHQLQHQPASQRTAIGQLARQPAKATNHQHSVLLMRGFLISVWFWCSIETYVFLKLLLD